MTLNEAVNVLRRYSDYRRKRDRRPMQESFPDALTMIVPVAIDVLLVHMSAATPIAYRESRRARRIRMPIRMLDEISEECRKVAEEPTREYPSTRA